MKLSTWLGSQAESSSWHDHECSPVEYGRIKVPELQYRTTNRRALQGHAEYTQWPGIRK
ncbi:hypothetical protein M404DRAFT_997684 [Pisolithus tinctorius Marx 270]|uniref:Uncharacterized protein n=1 Tax=Pisolithus tinctorius Marx 270 TaxID=870435 RepID=A0A0C3NRY3_PISTI|nr:hypothetical protein M404DRAFT_1005583 [Pisolithus tinctorius Marx 270]KIO08123.1 hypothetical protein M404DRAFT_997684 [Pisolithus tinctorius Marx 270]